MGPQGDPNGSFEADGRRSPRPPGPGDWRQAAAVEDMVTSETHCCNHQQLDTIWDSRARTTPGDPGQRVRQFAHAARLGQAPAIDAAATPHNGPVDKRSVTRTNGRELLDMQHSRGGTAAIPRTTSAKSAYILTGRTIGPERAVRTRPESTRPAQVSTRLSDPNSSAAKGQTMGDA